MRRVAVLAAALTLFSRSIVPSTIDQWRVSRNRPFRIVPSCVPYQTGTASWYGPGFHGRLTSSGEVYDQWGVTAAHRRLPLHTSIRVRRLDTGASVDVRVNDRGPYIDGRVLDLSREAARRLHMERRGLSEVQVYVCR